MEDTTSIYLVTKAQPIALVLGSDNKPAKVRVYDADCGLVSDIWLVESVVRGYLSWERFISRYNDKWVLFTYDWLPVVDCYDNIVRDGFTIIHAPRLQAGSAFFKIEDSEAFQVCDARGRSRSYTTGVLWDIASKDAQKKMFCNLDYSRLLEHDTRCLYPFSRTRRVIISEANLSHDIIEIKSAMMHQGVEFRKGAVKLSNDFFSDKQVVIPRNWTTVIASPVQGIPSEVICFPDDMYSLTLSIEGCSQLKSLVLPTKIRRVSERQAACTIEVFDCPRLEELVVPSSISNSMDVAVHSCSSLKRIVSSENRLFPVLQQARFSVQDCPNLTEIDVPNLRLSAKLLRCPNIQLITCQSSSFEDYGGAVRMLQPQVNFRIIGYSKNEFNSTSD